MRAGQLRETVVIERPVETQTPSGEVVTTWVPMGTRRAAVEPLTARERVVGQETHAERDHRIVLRRDRLTRTITAKMRIRQVRTGLADRVFDIAPPLDRGPRLGIELLATEQA